MVKYCIYPGCDRRLRTGRKYCHIHRSFSKEQKGYEWDIDPRLGLLLLGFMFLVVMYVGLLEFIEYSKQNVGEVIVSIMGLIILAGIFWFLFKKAKEIDEHVKKRNKIKKLV